MAGSIEKEFQQIPNRKEPLPRYKLKSPSGSTRVIIIDTHRQIRNNPNLEQVSPLKPHVKK